MARANLSALLGNVDEPPAVAPPVEVRSPVAEPSTPLSRRTREPKRRSQPASSVTAEPPYLRLVRKEARLRDDQYAALTQHARRLSRAQGADEADLRESLR
jgi:hypothetical protein